MVFLNCLVLPNFPIDLKRGWWRRLMSIEIVVYVCIDTNWQLYTIERHWVHSTTATWYIFNDDLLSFFFEANRQYTYKDRANTKTLFLSFTHTHTILFKCSDPTEYSNQNEKRLSLRDSRHIKWLSFHQNVLTMRRRVSRQNAPFELNKTNTE